MNSPLNSTTYLTLKDVQKVIDSLGDFTNSTLDKHSMVLVINNTGEATFTSCGWKLLSEAGFSHPLTKFVNNAVMNYTKLCGDDCKYFLFILREMFSVVHNKITGCNEAFLRRSLMNEIVSLKQTLPCIFKGIRDISINYVIELDSELFLNNLRSLVLTFMLFRFSVSVSKKLSSLICDFIEKISGECNSAVDSLEYIISHFDIFCCKILSPLSESKVLKGLLLFQKSVPFVFSLEKCKFVVVWDLSLKLEIKNVTWKITDESFLSQLNPVLVFQKVFEYFKSLNIELILTPSVSDNNLKLLCEKNGIFLIDRLEKDEIECMLTCFHLSALENFNESLESHHIGELNFAKSFSFNKSHFLHLDCTNSFRLFSTYHILLSAPYNAVWKEYYSECLNCFKMIHQWMKTDVNSCFQNEIVEDNLNTSTQTLAVCKANKDFCICPDLKVNYQTISKEIMSLDIAKSIQNGGLLSPGLWELLLKCILGIIPVRLRLSCSMMLNSMHHAILKMLCKRVGVAFTNIQDIESAYAKFIKTCKLGDISFLEPVVCKEIMIYNILDLILHLLKIDCIVFIK